jgi:hypothetical protein
MTEPDEVHTMLCRGGYTSCDERHDERKPVRRFGWGHLMALVIIGTLIWCAGLFLTGSRAAEPPDCAWVRPAQHHQARTCRAEGWLIDTMLAVSPHGVVKRTYLPACTFEDGSGGPLPCSWNFTHEDGNGQGLAYWITKSRHVHYVWARTPKAIRDGSAHWPTWPDRQRFGLDTSCWVKHPRPHHWQYQCPEDGAPS